MSAPIWILQPDADGNCCDCAGRVEPCDSCTTPTGQCSCVLFIPPVSIGGSYSNYAAAQSGIANNTSSCLAYQGPDPGNGIVTVFDASDLVAHGKINTSVDPQLIDSLYFANMDVYVDASLVASSTLTVSINTTFGGSPVGLFCSFTLALFQCDGTFINSAQVSYSVAGVYPLNLTIPTDTEYIIGILTTASTTSPLPFSRNTVITISSSSLFVFNPIVAKYDDSGIARQLEACPKMLLPPFTEDSHNWYTNKTEAQAVIDNQTSNCVGYFDHFPTEDTLTFSATNGGSSITTDYTFTVPNPIGLVSAINARCFFSVEALKASILSFNGTFDYSSDLGCGTTMTLVVEIYDYLGQTVQSIFIGSLINVLHNPSSLSFSVSSMSLPYSGRYFMNLFVGNNTSICSPSTHVTTVHCVTTSSSTMTVNPIQALYDVGLTCAARLDCS